MVKEKRGAETAETRKVCFDAVRAIMCRSLRTGSKRVRSLGTSAFQKRKKKNNFKFLPFLLQVSPLKCEEEKLIVTPTIVHVCVCYVFGMGVVVVGGWGLGLVYIACESLFCVTQFQRASVFWWLLEAQDT